MSFQYLLYLKLDRQEEIILRYSHIFIIFGALIQQLEHEGGLIFKNVQVLLFVLSPHYSGSGKRCLDYLGTKKSQNEC